MSAFAADMGIDDSASSSSEQTVSQAPRRKGQPAPFVQKLYKLIDTCDPDLVCWTTDGDMFVVKDPQKFEQTVIPRYFGHNKFASFARQLNFYEFRKVHSRPIRNADFDAKTAKHITYYHQHFQRGRTDLLMLIKRPTRDDKARDQPRKKEIQCLREKISDLQTHLTKMLSDFDERVAKMSEKYLQELRSLHEQLPFHITGGVQWPEQLPALGSSADNERPQQINQIPMDYRNAAVASSGEEPPRIEANFEPLPYQKPYQE